MCWVKTFSLRVSSKGLKYRYYNDLEREVGSAIAGSGRGRKAALAVRLV